MSGWSSFDNFWSARLACRDNWGCVSTIARESTKRLCNRTDAHIHTYVRAHAHASRSLARMAGKLERSSRQEGGGIVSEARRRWVPKHQELSPPAAASLRIRPPPLLSSTLRWIFVAGWEFIPRCFDQSRARAVRCRVAIKRDNAFSQETPLPRDHFQSRDWLSEFFGLIGAPRAPPRASDRAPLRLPFVRCWDRVHLYESLDTRAN